MIMQVKTIYMLKADEGLVLKKGDIYTSAVLLREDETPDGWTEVPFEEFEAVNRNAEMAD